MERIMKSIDPDKLTLGKHDKDGYWVERVDAENSELAKYLQDIPTFDDGGNVYGVLLNDLVIWNSQRDVMTRSHPNSRISDARELLETIRSGHGYIRNEDIPASFRILAKSEHQEEPYRIGISGWGDKRDDVRKLVTYVLLARPRLDAKLLVSLQLGDRLISLNQDERPYQSLYRGKVWEVMIRAAVDAVMGERNGYSNR